jgi:hypothetical protein
VPAGEEYSILHESDDEAVLVMVATSD